MLGTIVIAWEEHSRQRKQPVKKPSGRSMLDRYEKSKDEGREATEWTGIDHREPCTPSQRLAFNMHEGKGFWKVLLVCLF